MQSESEKSAVDDTSPMLSSEGQQKHRSRGNRLQPDSATNAADGKSNSTNPDDDGEDDEEQADYFFLLSQQQRRWNRWGYMWSRSVEYLRFTVWRKTSLCLCASLAEVVACAVFVPNSWSDIIALSWVGYLAMLILPVVIFKSASWVSHALILVCGSRVNTADASRMLFCYWLTTTVLSLGTLLITMFWIVTSLVPYVWGLQVLMMPYAVACEWIALESREYQATNPYKEIAEVYREHIDTTMQNSKEYFLH
ncbi:transmembrane protein, putative [Bodo saltans]|uniref:Transmembrane protein, putative n=1 Tax=Bodo saltans TaxID=75058 RepID=A0A0S4J0X1_BODSA|nr:transmembrane protein, putative [Bodo saltans]|eukprot:CUG25306.1 transmembrane protein, putative [Bodo saltans]